MSTVDIPSSDQSRKAPGETCPRCHTTQSWGESSWCPNCSYYPVVDRAGGGATSWADDLPDVPVEEVEDTRSALESIPVWFWGMLGGVVGITAFSVTVRLMLPEDDSPRGVIALVQLAVGMISLLVAHGIASRHALMNDRRLNFVDILLSWFNVWQPTIAELPHTYRRVLAMTWGCFACLTAVTIMGGIDYSAPFRVHQAPDVKPMKLIGAVAAAARAQAAQDDPADMTEAFEDLQSEIGDAQEGAGQGGPKTMKEALDELGNMEDQLDAISEADPDAAAAIEELETITLNCFIYGVETDSNNVPNAFLFAANTLGKDQHVARIKTEDLPREDFRTMAVQLYTAIQKTPEIDTENEAVWVSPIVTCRLAAKGFAKNGELRDPEFQAIVINQRGRMDSTERNTTLRR